MSASSGNDPSSRPVQKKILHAGKNPQNRLNEDVKYENETKVRFHIMTKLLDGTVLDNSRDWTQPMELIFGKKFKMEVWELCIQTMEVNEVASFKCQKQLTFNYPTVAKTLRETFHPVHKKKKEESGHGEHMCGMMAMQTQGGLGHDDLNQLMKDPVDLEFVIELLSVEHPDDYNKESWQMKPEEKMKLIPALKAEGNDLYKLNKIKEAEEKYKQALGMLEQLMLREKPEDKEWLEFRSQKLPLLLNFAQCKLSQKDYYAVIEHTSEVIEADHENVKALFRRGKAHAGCWNPKAAKEDFQRVMELDSTLEKSCLKELKIIEDMEKQKDKEDKEKLKNLF